MLFILDFTISLKKPLIKHFYLNSLQGDEFRMDTISHRPHLLVMWLNSFGTSSPPFFTADQFCVDYLWRLTVQETVFEASFQNHLFLPVWVSGAAISYEQKPLWVFTQELCPSTGRYWHTTRQFLVQIPSGIVRKRQKRQPWALPVAPPVQGQWILLLNNPHLLP